ncbi:MAG: MCE family protein [Balneolaceae bacterium]|nr:MCE family protein [Balneolaceae bacterium]
MANISNETKITITIIAALVVAFFGYRFMKDLPLFRQSQVIYTYFPQVNGLNTGSYIYINGVKVGSIKKMELVGKDSVEVTLGFNLGTEIKRGSIAYLESSGLLGDKAINIQQGNSEEKVPDGGTIKGVYSGGMLEAFKESGAQLTNDASESFNKLNRTLTQLQGVIDQDNQQKIDSMLGSLEQATAELSLLMRRKRAELESSITHANRFFGNLDTVTTENRARIDSALAGLERSVDNFEQVSSELETTNKRLNSILVKLDNGQGSLGKMINDPSLYNNMDSLSVELNTLIRNINNDPARYLKGLKLIDIF